jgi:hypothetical protein
MMCEQNWLLRVCAVLNVVFELAILTDAHSFITPDLMNTCRLLEITMKHFLFFTKHICTKTYFTFHTFIWASWAETCS